MFKLRYQQWSLRKIKLIRIHTKVKITSFAYEMKKSEKTLQQRDRY